MSLNEVWHSWSFCLVLEKMQSWIGLITDNDHENIAVAPWAICLSRGTALNQTRLTFLNANFVIVQGFKALRQI